MIEAIGLVKAFGRTRSLDGFTFTARPGVTGLLGPNGAGKTTLIRMLATVLAPDRGELRLLGRDPAKDRLEIRRRLGYLPQEPGYQRGFTVFEFVDYVAILKEMTDRRARHDEVRRVIEEVGLAPVSGRRIRTLSGGMRRRLGIAQALLGDPELLLLDEPTAGLDPEQRLRFRELILTIGAGRTVVLSTHQTEDVAALCTRVVVVKAGRCEFEGTPEDVRALAEGRVWFSEQRAGVLSWRTGDGLFRNIGSAPEGARMGEPTMEDGYLLLLGDDARTVTA
ncbi:ATP-binding cassette domain-containing protein [Microtetraspora sp. AC03309]|uniref:ATP-binding cassette domain-containing protein n=1 Tax=Microtetraspora sp. AC03309 TaxID=2779376 RepID=UPI001E4F22D8|nr:ATP-binding cassette domain-containing protein [Microtetraspora sp. AC03309]MCC5574914.1 ATP-binding cassette domain-containing protein [Microtetraspora sp. AC03309]